jgi:hypothetical protein
MCWGIWFKPEKKEAKSQSKYIGILQLQVLTVARESGWIRNRGNNDPIGGTNSWWKGIK